MPSRKNLRHRIKARRELALANLERHIADPKWWKTPRGDEGDGVRLAKAKAEAIVLHQRLGTGI